jgi:phosphatidylserine/phosphatidylglycerophosphate/cardiolipin synthase-like enzyme
MNINDDKRDGLLGFAIERLSHRSGKTKFLSNFLSFDGVCEDENCANDDKPCTSACFPIQSFRWSDYTVFPDTEYDYTIHPAYGDWHNPTLEAGPTVTVRTANAAQGEHRVLFNRAAAASQAFSGEFPDVVAAMSQRPIPPTFQLPPAARDWLTRGLRPQIVNFIGLAMDETWALDIAIYEYELAEIVQAVNEAFARQANVRVVYHAKAHDDQTAENERNLGILPDNQKTARHPRNIFHDKFIVLSRIENGVRQPKMVLCGSTNFTEHGLHKQANVVHIVERTDVARQYLDLFEVLFGGAGVAATRDYIDANDAMPDPAAPPALFVGFSPRSNLLDLHAFVTEIGRARRDVLFCTAFDLHPLIDAALLGAAGDGVLRYGLENKRTNITGYHADRNADFTVPALLPDGLEGWLKETNTLGNAEGDILIHTKIILVNFTSDEPIVISGSHNLSKSASESNDENYLIIRGNLDVADCYGCELMRLYDHYRFRFHEREGARSDGTPLTLKKDNSWTDPYYDNQSLRRLDRFLFAGENPPH